MATAWPWLALLLLGALHGVNPGMGWLFAVALGLQEKRRGAVWGALGPLAVGHALAMVATLAVAAALGAVLSLTLVRWIVAASLALLGVRALVRHRHPRGGGMRVNARDLTMWSFLMATAHGAGLMALPLVLDRVATPAGSHAMHAMHGVHAVTTMGMQAQSIEVLAASAMHAAGYLLVTGIIAVVVYERLGLRMLRSAWINLDAFWAAALVITGIVTVL